MKNRNPASDHGAGYYCVFETLCRRSHPLSHKGGFHGDLASGLIFHGVHIGAFYDEVAVCRHLELIAGVDFVFEAVEVDAEFVAMDNGHEFRNRHNKKLLFIVDKE